MTGSPLEETTLTLYVPETPDASNTVTDAYVTNMEINESRGLMTVKNVLRTRPVSSTLLPTEEPAIRDSRMEDTSDAATMTCQSKDNVTSQRDACTRGQYGEPGFAVAYERATAGATREAF